MRRMKKKKKKRRKDDEQDAQTYKLWSWHTKGIYKDMYYIQVKYKLKKTTYSLKNGQRNCYFRVLNRQPENRTSYSRLGSKVKNDMVADLTQKLDTAALQVSMIRSL